MIRSGRFDSIPSAPPILRTRTMMLLNAIISMCTPEASANVASRDSGAAKRRQRLDRIGCRRRREQSGSAALTEVRLAHGRLGHLHPGHRHQEEGAQHLQGGAATTQAGQMASSGPPIQSSTLASLPPDGVRRRSRRHGDPISTNGCGAPGPASGWHRPGPGEEAPASEAPLRLPTGPGSFPPGSGALALRVM